MILIGQYDSAFVRRVGITLRLYGLPFEPRPWSVFADIERLTVINPVGSVPVLVLEDGTAINDSSMILTVLDAMVEPDRRLWPADQIAARRIVALATGLTDRFVSLYYERAMHPATARGLEARRTGQVQATLARLESERAVAGRAWWFGDRLTQADITLACVIRHLSDSLPDLWDATRHPALAAHSARAEALAVFQEISQPFVAPAG
jgi:glutathione S-transferase